MRQLKIMDKSNSMLTLPSALLSLKAGIHSMKKNNPILLLKVYFNE